MSSIVSNYEENSDRASESRRKKRRRIESVRSEDPSSSDQIRWRSSAEQTTYSSKLLEALRHVRRTSSPASSISSRSRAVRDTADKILAIAARGRSRWSRAILANRFKCQLQNHKKAPKPYNKSNPAAATGNSRLQSLIAASQSQTKKLPPPLPLPPLQRRVRLLGRLVPGCRKLSFPKLLEETTDYISALEMQVRALSALAGLLTGAGSAAGISDWPDLT